MTSPLLEILAYEPTPLGTLCLRRRRTASEPIELVTEITLDGEFLMSSLHTDSEQALAQIPLRQIAGEQLSVLVGGLGLGYTASAALAFETVATVEVVEYLPQVIDWLKEGLIPLAPGLNAEPRLHVTQGDVYAKLMGPPEKTFDAILIDVDHSPEDQLSSASAPFYTLAGLTQAKEHLSPGGMLALWSYAEDTPLLETMRQVLTDVTAHGITYYNRHVHEEFTDWLYVGRRG